MRFSFAKKFVSTGLILAGCVAPSAAELYINEIFFNPGGDGVETRDEFIELRGAPGMDLANHFLLFIENEDNAAKNGPAGQIDNIFDLGAASIGSNGFLTFRMGGDQMGSGSSLYAVAPGTSDFVNMGSGAGYGSGPTSTIGAEDDGNEGVIENGGFTAMLIRNDGDPVANRPTIAFDLDVGNDGLDHPSGREGWTILDSIGIHGEPREAVFGRTYAPINFGYESIGQVVIVPGVGIATANPGLEPGATYVPLGYEIEYIARWGNSTGQTASDWHISNLTDNPGAGSAGAPVDYRQSFTGNHAALASGSPDVAPSQPTAEQGRLESNKNVPYGTKLLTTIGAPNYITGDFNGDGVVDTADYTVWRDTKGQLGSESAHPAADANHDFAVNEADYALWAQYFGAPHPVAPSASGVTVPEPATLLIAALAATAVIRRNRC
jgi:hypothetical protein